MNKPLFLIVSSLLFFSFSHGVWGKLTLSDLAVSKEAGLNIKPSFRAPASVAADKELPAERPQVRTSDFPRVQTFMSISCSDRMGWSHHPGDAGYSHCMENSDLDRNFSIYQQNGFKHLQMGIIFR